MPRATLLQALRQLWALPIFHRRTPSEVIGLQWKHITERVIQFRQAVVVSKQGLVLKEGLKTQCKRDFPITPEVKAILDDIKSEAIDPEAFIFRSPRGKFIDQHNFANRSWQGGEGLRDD
ncbi:hypothetical protein FM036_46860 [Nostoc sp. HG1]|nr:hypothetical protein [Nostoc sp. HG1]